MRDGLTSLVALSKALYEVREWADKNLPKEDSRFVGWGVFYILDDLVAHLRNFEPSDIRALVEQVPPFKSRL